MWSSVVGQNPTLVEEWTQQPQAYGRGFFRVNSQRVCCRLLLSTLLTHPASPCPAVCPDHFKPVTGLYSIKVKSVILLALKNFPLVLGI